MLGAVPQRTVPGVRQRIGPHPAPSRNKSLRCVAYRLGSALAPEVPYSQWKKRVLDNPLPVMVHLWSETMVPARSKALAPIVAEVALEFSGRIDACTLAYDTDPHALDIETRCIPAVAFFKGGQVADLVYPMNNTRPEQMKLAYEELCGAANRMLDT